MWTDRAVAGSSSRVERSLLAGMAALAGVAVALTGPGSLARDWALPFTLTAAAAGASVVTARWRSHWRRDSGGVAAVAAAAGVWAHAFEPSGATAALDVLLLGAAAGLLPALTAWSWEPGVARLVALLSAFVVMIETSFASQPTTGLVVLTYAATAVTWATLSTGGPSAARRRAVGLGLACVVTGGTVGLRASGVPAARALAGFLPSSGGTGDGSAAARAGVGDGPDEVAGEQAASNGFDQTDRFSESAQDGLYDLFVEAYGKPAKSKPAEKMVGLKPADARVVEGRDRQDLRSGRLFELRRSAAAPPPAATRAADDALLYVEGRTPLRLRLTTFDRFDGTAWEEASARKIPASLRVADREHWLSFVSRPDFSGEAAAETHRIKVVALPGDVLPMPPAARRFKLGRANRPSFYRESHGDLLTLVRDTIPPGSVLHVEAPTRDPARQTPGEVVTARVGRWAADAPLDAGLRPLVEDWTAGVAAGWPQVDAVVRGVRGHGRYARGAAIDAADPVRAFLKDRRPGNDYHFATAAALALRSLGYRTRLVGGLYAPPDAVDPQTHQTAVRPGDVHFWPEIRLPTGAWVPLEPTPGYELLGPRVGYFALLRDRCRAAWAAVYARRAVLAGVAGVTVLVRATRRRLADAGDVLLWRLRFPGDAALGVRRTAALLERRAGRYRAGRPTHETRSTWLRGLARHDAAGGDAADAADDVAGLVDWADYGPETPPPAGDARAACRSLVRRLDRRRFRSITKDSPS